MIAHDLRPFLRSYSDEVRSGSAALFVGAGLSVPAGLPNWKKLLSDVAKDLGLDVELESDLIALAQFHYNQQRSRDRISQIVIDHFVDTASPTENHKIIATLPIRSVWTTNYDELLEAAYKTEHKRVDIKRRDSDLSTHMRDADVTIYKMHGCATARTDVILTKEDYEDYVKKRELFTLALKTDLVAKSFLFIGFSFSDPNIGQILGHVRQMIGQHGRTHYWIVKRPRAGENGETENSCRRFEHQLTELARYKLKPVIINEYSEISDILLELQRYLQLRDVFVSGSSRGLNVESQETFDFLCRHLGAELISNGFNVISGFGRGVATQVMLGASEKLKRNDDQRLRVMPFPRAEELTPTSDHNRVKTKHREKLISRAGVCVVLAGVRGETDAAPSYSEGVREEVRIAKRMNKVIIPIGATDWVAREVWEEVRGAPREYYGDVDVTAQLEVLGNKEAGPVAWVQAVLQIAQAVSR